MLHDLWEARAPVDRAELHRRLDELLDLRDRTHPATCADPATVPVLDPPPKTIVINGLEHEVNEVVHGKDETALWALWIAQDLVVSAVGWAVNHRVGRAVAPEQ